MWARSTARLAVPSCLLGGSLLCWQQRLEADNRRTYPVIWGFALAGLVGGAVILVALFAVEDWLLDRPLPSLGLTALSVISMATALVLMLGCHKRTKRLAALRRTEGYRRSLPLPTRWRVSSAFCTGSNTLEDYLTDRVQRHPIFRHLLPSARSLCAEGASATPPHSERVCRRPSTWYSSS